MSPTRARRPATASWATRRTVRATSSSPGWAYSGTSRRIVAVMASASEPGGAAGLAGSTSAYCSTTATLLASNATVTCAFLSAGDNRRPYSLTAVSRRAADADL